MSNQRNFISLLAFIIFVGLFSYSCDLSESTETPAPSGPTPSMAGTLGLPAAAPGCGYYIILDVDGDRGNGMAAYETGTCGSGASITYEIFGVPAGQYKFFAVVNVVTPAGAFQYNGDYFKYYPQVNIADGQTRWYSPEMSIVDWEIDNSILRGYFIMPAATPGTAWSVYLDSDLIMSNGWAADAYGHCSDETIAQYGIDTAPPGTYYLYAMVHIASGPGGEETTGDYYGVVSGVTIPATGQVIQDINMSVVTANLE